MNSARRGRREILGWTQPVHAATLASGRRAYKQAFALSLLAYSFRWLPPPLTRSR
jgi:hypothetical protein